MIDLELLKRFYVVAQSKNITHAAKKLNIVQSALSKSISAFEQQLKVPLFSRTRKGLEMNSKGLELYDYAKKVLADTALFEKKFYDDDQKMQGDLKILAYPYIGANFLMSFLKDFMKNNPTLSINIIVDSDNIVPIEADISIGHYIENYPDLVQTHLLTLDTHLFASQDYLKNNGIPETEEDLNNHFIISYEGNTHYSYPKSTDMALIAGMPSHKYRKPNLTINSLQGIINALENNYGIAQLPCFPHIVHSNLQVVLPHLKTSNKKTDLYFTYRKNRENSLKIKSLYTHLKQCLESYK